MSPRGLGLVFACGLVVACAGRGSVPFNPTAVQPQSNPLRAPLGSAAELPEPPVVHAVNGVAKLSLVADLNPLNGLPTLEYQNQQAVIPTIDVKAGDTIVLDLTDNLPAVPPPDLKNVPEVKKMSEDVNLHFHGLGSSPHAPGDDVLTMLATPGQTLHYVVHVPPNQEPGLYWYHPHVHGQTNLQVGEGGMSGALVVEGLDRHLPGLSKMKQRVIVVRATGNGGDVLPLHTNRNPCTAKDGLTVSLNGVVKPTITIAPGERQFFRVVNATGHKTLRLKVDGEQLVLVAIDGFALDTYPGTPPTLTEPSIIVPPAARAEFVVTGPSSGHAKLRTLCYNTGPNGDPDPELVLANLKAPASGRFPATVAPLRLAVGAPLPRNVYTTALPPPAAKRVVVFSENAKPEFFINGKAFSPKAPPMFVVHVGTVEEWHILNVTQEIHDFHIHQTHFLVESINGVKVAHPYWADSVVIPHRRTVGSKSVPGSLVLLMDFRDPIIKGEFVFHCHILDHEDRGMMAKIQAI